MRPKAQRGSHTAVALCALLIGLLVGCSGEEHPGSEPSVGLGEQTKTTGDIPVFTGPWASDFDYYYRRAVNDFIRDVLRDNEITDQEVNEMRERFKQCLEPHGFTGIYFQDDGSMSLTPPRGMPEDDANHFVSRCSTDSGEDSVGALASWIRRKPNNEDEHTAIATCLVRKGVVDPSYTAKDYTSDFKNNTLTLRPGISEDEGEQAFLKCNADPTGILE